MSGGIPLAKKCYYGVLLCGLIQIGLCIWVVIYSNRPLDEKVRKHGHTIFSNAERRKEKSGSQETHDQYPTLWNCDWYCLGAWYQTV